MKSNSLTLASLMLLAACASTTLKTSWRSPEFVPASLKKVLVLGIGMKPESQKQLELSFVKALQAHGAAAVAAHSLAPTEPKIDEALLRKAIAEQGFDSVLVARFTNVETIDKDVPPQVMVAGAPRGGYGYGGYYGYYNYGSQVIVQPGYSYSEDYAIVETKLYAVTGEKLLWSGDSRTSMGDGSRVSALIREYARLAVKAIYGRQ